MRAHAFHYFVMFFFARFELPFALLCVSVSIATVINIEENIAHVQFDDVGAVWRFGVFRSTLCARASMRHANTAQKMAIVEFICRIHVALATRHFNASAMAVRGISSSLCECLKSSLGLRASKNAATEVTELKRYFGPKETDTSVFYFLHFTF